MHIHAICYGRRLDNQIRGNCKDCGQNLLKYDRNEQKHYCANSKCKSPNVEHKKDSKIVRLWVNSSGRKVNMDIKKLSSSEHTFNYLLKYISASKDSFATPKDEAIYVHATRKKRLLSTTGIFYKTTFPKIKGEKICYECKSPPEFITDPELVDVIERRHGYKKKSSKKGGRKVY